jgi:hypothetical protein
MAKPQPINCPVCGECCGRYHQPTFECDGESEGPGEDFPDVEGEWCCSEECRMASNGLKADRIIAERDKYHHQVKELLRRGVSVLKIGDHCTICHALVSCCECFGRRGDDAR